MKKSLKVCIAVLAALALILGSSAVTVTLVSRKYEALLDTRSETEQKTAEISAYLEKYFIDDYDEKTLADAAASAMVTATGDRWSYYLAPEFYADYAEQMNNAYVGVGVTITMDEEAGGMRIVAVASGGPAEEAGVQIDDILTQVEGQDVLSLGTQKTRELVRGEEGSFVSLRLLRDGQTLDVSVERRSIQTEVVSSRMLGDEIGYIKINNFDARSAEESIAAVDALISGGAQALLFDVRFNGGGYKDEMVQLLDKLLPEGELFQSEDYTGKKEIDRSDASCVELPMAVLVNADSYSAAEFFAAALQEYEWASVVGEKTTGKGNFQTAFRLSDGSLLNLSIGKYYTPQGRSLSETGVTPDVSVELSEQARTALGYGQLAQEDDAQLQAAQSLLLEELHP